MMVLLLGLLGLAPTQASESACEPIVEEQSEKRGAAYHFCGWPFTGGEADLAAMQPGLAWTYNWSAGPLECPDGKGVGAAMDSSETEFVPMAWGLVDQGAACAEGGPCFRVDILDGGDSCQEACNASNWSFDPAGDCYACYHAPISREEFLARIPASSKHLLGYNEPNFKEQANLEPTVAAAGWEHIEWVADQRELAIVGPATNFCDPTPGALHPGACIEAVDGIPMLGLAWTEKFYDACSADGAAGRDCRIDYQAVHAYSCGGIQWMIERMKRKAGLLPPVDEHCTNGVQDGDEFGEDCGGNDCVACSEHARALFAKPVWLTEFAPMGAECAGESPEAIAAHAEQFMRSEIPALEADDYVYRYAWFMPKTDLASLDHADLLVQDKTGERSTLGALYFGEAPECEPAEEVGPPADAPEETRKKKRRGRKR